MQDRLEGYEEKDFARSKGQVGYIIGGAIGIAIAAIVVFQIVLPILTTAAVSLTGTNAILAGLVSLLVVLLLVVAVLSMMGIRITGKVSQ